jgi:hypothetical protein
MMLSTPDTTIADVLAAWDAGESIFSIEMGGLGPGYEQAIQVLIIELLRDHGAEPLPRDDDSAWGDDTARRISEACLGFSGAQVGAAKTVAYRIIRDGYHATLESMRAHDSDRLIQISKAWPRTPEVVSASDRA